jgi:hypothetical protein
MSLRDCVISSFGVHTPNQESVLARNDLHCVVILDLQQFEEGLVENESAAIPNLLELLNHVLTML